MNLAISPNDILANEKNWRARKHSRLAGAIPLSKSVPVEHAGLNRGSSSEQPEERGKCIPDERAMKHNGNH